MVTETYLVTGQVCPERGEETERERDKKGAIMVRMTDYLNRKKNTGYPIKVEFQ